RIEVFVDGRLQMGRATRRYRIPDVMVLETPYQKGKVAVDVPAVVVEIKSPDDTFDDIVDRCFEYQKLGVPNILVMDPDNRRAWLFEQGTLLLLDGNSVSLSLRQSTLDFPFVEMFAQLDEQ